MGAHPGYTICLTTNQKTPTLVTYITTLSKQRFRAEEEKEVLKSYLEAIRPLTTASLEITKKRKIELGAFRNSLAHLFLPTVKDEETLEVLKIKATTEVVEDRIAFSKRDIIKATWATLEISNNLERLMLKNFPDFCAEHLTLKSFQLDHNRLGE